MSRTAGPPTIVVIDDSQIVLSVTRSLLEAAGFRVITHSRPAGCVALILQEKPDLVLIDVNMPLIAGDTIAKLFGKAQPNSETVILLHSSLSAEALEAKAAACGAHGYVQKSDDGYDFVRQISSWLKRGSSGKLRAAPRYEPDDDVLSRPSGARPVARNTNWSNDAPSSVSMALDSAGAIDARASGTLRIASQVVLFIDDDMNALSTLRRDVQREAYSVEFALSGNQALRRILSNTPPDLVVCDLLMPDPNGIEVYRRAVAADARWRQRFVFTTDAHVAEVSRFLASFSGVVLAKPINPDRLRNAIRDGLALEEQALREQSSR